MDLVLRGRASANACSFYTVTIKEQNFHSQSAGLIRDFSTQLKGVS
jgi:hypothetical protein